MNIYKISQTTNIDHDTFDNAIVVAASPKEAALIHPKQLWYQEEPDQDYSKWDGTVGKGAAWVPVEEVKVTFIGVADRSYKENKVICASFNAG